MPARHLPPEYHQNSMRLRLCSQEWPLFTRIYMGGLYIQKDIQPQSITKNGSERG
jgi:hypothetical protein